MAYTPELGQRQSAILRRLAWAVGMPMTATLHEIMEFLAAHADQSIICARCKDTSACQDCAFNRD